MIKMPNDEGDNTAMAPLIPIKQIKNVGLQGALRLAGELADILKSGDVVALSGDLGSGKSHLARALIRAAAQDQTYEVPSPTFTLLQPYDALLQDGGAIWHYDLYRLEQPEDITELGFEQGLSVAASLIEWPEKMGSFLPENSLVITIKAGKTNDQGEGSRTYGFFGNEEWQDRLSPLSL